MKNIPYSKEVEEAVLSSMFVNSGCVDEVLMVVKSDQAFYDNKNKIIFKAIQSLVADNEPIDIITVSSKLRSQSKLSEIGGDIALIELSRKVSSSAHIDVHSRLLLQFMVKRMIITINTKITSMAYSDSSDIFELIAEWSGELDKLNELILTGRKTASFAEALDVLEKRIEFLSTKTESEITGVCTGFEKINKFTGGYQPSDLIILAARPGMGKTAKVLKTAISNAKKDNAVGFISLEMSVHQLTTRAVAIDTDFHLGQLFKTGFEKDEYFTTFSAHKHRMKKYPIYIDDSGSSDISEIISIARLWKRQHGIKLLVIDYIQLMSDRTKSHQREQEVSTITRKLKRLAKELDIPVIALSQLSRKVEERGGDKRPRLSDLRESGAIEQDADIIEFIYRPEYYNIEVPSEFIEEGVNTEVNFAKYRNGSLATIGLYFDGNKTKFMDADRLKEDHYNSDVPKLEASQAFDKPINEVPF